MNLPFLVSSNHALLRLFITVFYEHEMNDHGRKRSKKTVMNDRRSISKQNNEFLQQ